MTFKKVDPAEAKGEDAARLLRALELERIGNEAVHRAQEENRRLGIPNWYEVDGRLVSDRPDLTGEDRNK